MKSLNHALTLGALALLATGSLVHAEDATEKGYVTFPNTVRCQACGAEYHVLAAATKGNAIDIKLEQVRKGANPKVH